MPLADRLIKLISKTLMDSRPTKPSTLCDFDRLSHEIRPADVLLVEGQNRASRVIQRVTNSPWTHAMLYLGRLHDIENETIRNLVQTHYSADFGEQLIIESIIGKGTIISPLSDYKNDHIRICRPGGLSHQDAQCVINYAIQTLGSDYNLRHFFDLGRFLLASRFFPRRWKSTLFDHKHGQATQDICSAMIAKAFKSIQFPILPLIREDEKKQLEIIHRNPKLYTPSDFDYSPYFEIIKYPIFLGTNATAYRGLPWNNTLISNDEIGISNLGAETKDY